MNYLTQDFQITLPGLSADRSVNVLTLTEPESGTPFQLIVNRDELVAGETLSQCVDRQLGLMTRQAKTFKLVARQETEVGVSRVPGISLESSFFQSGKTYYQMQALFAPAPPQLLVVTLSSPTALLAGHRTAMREMLASLEFRAPAASTQPPEAEADPGAAANDSSSEA